MPDAAPADLASALHDLSQPIASLSLALELASMGRDEAELRAGILAAQHELDRLAVALQRLREWAAHAKSPRS